MLRPLATLLLAACAATPTAPESEGEATPLLVAHRQAIHDYQRLDRPGPSPGAICLERCAASDRACHTADALCAADPDAATCDEARTGCGWTRSLLPARCVYCTTYGR